MPKNFGFNFTMPEYKLYEQAREKRIRRQEWLRMEESLKNQRTIERLRSRP